MALTAVPITKPSYYDSATGKIHSGARMLVAVNLGWPHFWGAAKPFLNLVHGCENADATWLDNTSTSQTYTVNTADEWREGTYVLIWTGTTGAGSSECSLTFGGSPIAEDTTLGAAGFPTVNRKEYITSAATGFSTVSVSALAGDQCNDIEFFEKQYETERDAGNLISPQFISDISNFDVVRFKDWMAGDSGPWETNAGYPDETWVSWANGVPVKAICEVANGADVIPFIAVPAKFPTAQVALMAADFKTYLDVGREIYVEYGNEIWNFASTWADTYWWNVLYSTSASVATHDGAGLYTDVAHGLETGDFIRPFYNEVDRYNSSSWPLASGAGLRVYKLTNDTFNVLNWGSGGSLVNESGTDNNSTNSTTTMEDTTASFGDLTGQIIFNDTTGSFGTVTSNTSTIVTFSGGLSGGTDAFFNSGDTYNIETLFTTANVTFNFHQSRLTQMLYKVDTVQSGGSDTAYDQAATNFVMVWDEFDTVFGRDLVTHVGSTWVSQPTRMTERLLLNADYMAAVDIICFASYFNMKTKPDLATATDDEIKEQMIISSDEKHDVTNPAHQAVWGRAIFSCYEGGQIFTEQISTQEEEDRLVEFMGTQQYYDAIAYHLQRLSESGCKWHCYLDSHYPFSDSNATGLSTRGLAGLLGRITDQGFAVHVDFKTAGGVPKR